MKNDPLIDPVEELGQEFALQNLVDGELNMRLVPRFGDAAISRLPRLDVMITTVFRKSTVRPWPSVSRPSSRT